MDVGRFTEIKGIIDVSVVNEEIFVLHDGTNEGEAPTQPRIVHLALLSPGETAAAMTVAGNVSDGAAMLTEYYDNATPEKFLENVQEADLALVHQQLAEEPMAPSETVTKLAQIAARAEDLRKEEAAQNAAASEQAFMRSLNSREADGLVVDATLDGGSGEEDDDFAASLPGMSPAECPTPVSTSALRGASRLGEAESTPPRKSTGEGSEYGELDGPIVN